MSNNTIKQALFDILNNAALGYDIAWPAIKFKPPAKGIWLEVAFAPNSDLDNALPYDSGTIPRGIYQVSVFDRPGHGSFNAGDVAEVVQSLYAKGTLITGSVRVIKRPEIMPMDASDDKLGIAVSIEYTGSLINTPAIPPNAITFNGDYLTYNGAFLTFS